MSTVEPGLLGQLFRRSYSKYLAILLKLFGAEHLELLEDALQDAFAQATHAWRTNSPDNPEAWLNTVAKRRAIDLLRQHDALEQRHLRHASSATLEHFVDESFRDSAIADAELRVVFTACHPALKPQDQLRSRYAASPASAVRKSRPRYFLNARRSKSALPAPA